MSAEHVRQLHERGTWYSHPDWDDLVDEDHNHEATVDAVLDALALGAEAAVQEFDREEERERITELEVCKHCVSIGAMQVDPWTTEFTDPTIWPCPTIRALDAESGDPR